MQQRAVAVAHNAEPVAQGGRDARRELETHRHRAGMDQSRTNEVVQGRTAGDLGLGVALASLV